MVTDRDNAYIIPAKLAVPRLPDALIQRPRVDNLFLSACRAPLVLFQASAGFGKTLAALSGYHALAGDGDQVMLSWLSLDGSDDDLHTFMAHLYASLNETSAVSETVMPLSLPDRMMTPDAMVQELLQWFHELDGELVVVIDDFHHLQSPDIHANMAFMVRYLPSHVRLVLTSREELPAELANLQLKGMVRVIDSGDLAFSEAETAELLELQVGRELPASRVTEVWRQVEGWPVALHLQGLRWANATATEALETVRLTVGNETALNNYLESELFTALPESVQQFLLDTSVFRQFNQDFALELCPTLNVYDVLDYVLRNQLFVVQLDDEGQWYRYHALLREFLLRRLRIRDLDRLRGLQRRASRILVQAGQVVEAVEQANQSGDGDLIAALIEEHGNELIHRAHYELARRSLDQLSPERVFSRPGLLLVRCWVEAIYGQPRRVDEWVEQAREAYGDQPAWHDRTVSGELLTVQSQAAYAAGHHDRAHHLASEALSHLDDHDAGRQGALLVLANVLFDAGELDEARKVYEQGEVLSRRNRNYDAVLWALNQQGRIALQSGQLDKASGFAREGIEYAGREKLKPGFNLLLGHLVEIEIALEQYRLREARALIDQAIGFCDGWDDYWTLHLRSWQLKCELLRGRPRTAEALAAEHEPLLHELKGSDVLMPFSIETQTLWWFLEGDEPRLHTWRKTGQPGPVSAPVNASDFLLLRSIIYAQITEGEFEAAEQAVSMARQAARQRGFILEHYRLVLLNVALLQASGQPDSARLLLRRHLGVLSELGLIAFWLFYQHHLIPVIREIRSEGGLNAADQSYLDQILRLHKQRNTTDRPGADQVPDDLQALGVSRKEWRVYRHILHGQSNDEIAGAMFVALSTVKTHINNLYKKLGVRSRSEAMARARELPGVAESLERD